MTNITTKIAVARVLDEAAAYIEEHGWTQGVFENSDGQVCAIGAIRRVTGFQFSEFAENGSLLKSDVPWASEEWNLRQAALQTLDAEIATTTCFGSAILWNDYKGRTTPTKILETFRAAAKKLRAEADAL